jgi:hypothetical protein
MMGEPVDLTTWMGTKGAAIATGLSVWTIVRLVDAGKLDARNVSSGSKRRRLRINPESLERYKLTGDGLPTPAPAMPAASPLAPTPPAPPTPSTSPPVA